MINFAIGTQSFAVAGGLGELATDLGIAVGQAGKIVGAAS
jgi:predicted MFS family arabinose efflux permease